MFGFFGRAIGRDIGEKAGKAAVDGLSETLPDLIANIVVEQVKKQTIKRAVGFTCMDESHVEHDLFPTIGDLVKQRGGEVGDTIYAIVAIGKIPPAEGETQFD